MQISSSRQREERLCPSVDGKGSALPAQLVLVPTSSAPPEGLAFRRRGAGWLVGCAIGKAQPFPSTDGQSRTPQLTGSRVILTSLARRYPLALRWPGLATDGFLRGSSQT